MLEERLISGSDGNGGVTLVGGAFSSWKSDPIPCANSDSSTGKRRSLDDASQVDRDQPTHEKAAVTHLEHHQIDETTQANFERYKVTKKDMCEGDLTVWLQVLLESSDSKADLRSLLEDDRNFDYICKLVTAKVANSLKSKESENRLISPTSGRKIGLVPFAISSGTQRPAVLAANFVGFVQRIGNLTGTASPFKDTNPFVFMVVSESMAGKTGHVAGSVQQLVFNNEGTDALSITRFFYDVVHAADRFLLEETTLSKTDDTCKQTELNPSPFEIAMDKHPSTLLFILGFLGDPVAVCRTKMVKIFCQRIISENEHTVMRDAVRSGGMSMNVRPAFWMWVTLDKCADGRLENSRREVSVVSHEHPISGYPVPSKIAKLAQKGREGPWHGVIERDVARAFGNMPPHKTGAKLRADSIVRALVTFGHGRLIKRGVKGGGFAPAMPSIAASGGQRAKSKPRASTAPPPWEVGDTNSEDSDVSLAPTDTVSDWGGVSPVASFASSVGDEAESRKVHLRRGLSGIDNQDNVIDQPSAEVSRDETEDFVLNGNALTSEMKSKLQNQLEFILHALAAEHEDVGYCQGMDYIVAHLLRVLQDTVKWQASKGWLPAALADAAKALPSTSGVVSDQAINESLVVEEAVFRVMDCLFTTYNLRHIYWPELRSLKICCRVFERLVQHKLPVPGRSL
jgi:hypothetical protein